MVRLIDAEKIPYVDLNEDMPQSSIRVYVAFKERIDEQPTVDAVQVVRCKDCKYGSPNGKYGCICYHYRLYEAHEMKPEDFCSKAERKDNG